MKCARKLEKHLEQVVDGLTAVIFGGQLLPVDIANRLIREADLRVNEGRAGPEIPNHWTVRIGSTDLNSVSMHSLRRELAYALTATATERGWRTSGEIEIKVNQDQKLRKGNVAFDGQRRVRTAKPWGQLLGIRDGKSHELADNRILVGRALEADARVNDPKASRRHAVIFREAGQVWVVDLNSVNGTYVNGMRVGMQPCTVGPGDPVSFGPATFSLWLQ